MRVIAGSARRLSLMTPRGNAVRPTTDRIKETLFNMIRDEVPGCRFLDLFAGSGGIGIEALSEGADFCVFADNSRTSAACVKANLAHTHLEESAAVYTCDFRQTLHRLARYEPFDIVFLDPPYDRGFEIEALRLLASQDLVSEGGLIIIESLIDADYSNLIPDCFRIERIKRYKTNQHVFLRKENP